MEKRGHSKEKRSDCPLVTLALVLDSSGFPKCSKVFEGNISEAGTLANIISTMDAGRKSHNMFDAPKATIVMDAGIASEENIKWINEKEYPYIVVSRRRHREFAEEESVVVKQDKNGTVKVQKVIDPESNEVLLYCHSEKREAKERAIHDRFTSGFEEALTYLASGLHIPRRMKKYHKVLEKIGRLKQRYSRVSGQYQINVVKDEQTDNATKLTWQRQINQDTRNDLPGVYCLRTSHKDLDEKTLWQTYTMLTDLEAVFRSLKSELGIRPVFHQVTERVTGHLFISVLAYHLVHSVRYRLKQSQINSSWSQLRNQLESQSRVTVSMQCKDGQTVHIRKSTRPEPRQQEIYKALEIGLYPGPVIKNIFKQK